MRTGNAGDNECSRYGVEDMERKALDHGAKRGGGCVAATPAEMFMRPDGFFGYCAWEIKEEISILPLCMREFTYSVHLSENSPDFSLNC